MIHIAVAPGGRRDDICIAVRPDAPNLLRLLNVYLDKYVGLLDTATMLERLHGGAAESE